MPQELFLTTSQTTIIRNVLAKNISTDINLSKAQISKIIHSDGSFVSWLDNLGNQALTNTAITLARDNLPELISNLASNAIKKVDRKLSGKGAWEQAKDLRYLFRIKVWLISLKS